MFLTGEIQTAIQTINSGIMSFRSMGATLGSYLLLVYLAQTHVEIGQLDDASGFVSESIAIVERNNERWFEVEVHRTAGEIALRRSRPAEAEGHLERALSIARSQKARSWELRAAMSMARLWLAQDKQRAAHDLLAPIYGWFTEGFDTLDLKDAKALLDQLTIE
jgi:predicted ATPase